MERKGSKMREGGGLRGTRWKKEHGSVTVSVTVIVLMCWMWSPTQQCGPPGDWNSVVEVVTHCLSVGKREAYWEQWVECVNTTSREGHLDSVLFYCMPSCLYTVWETCHKIMWQNHVSVSPNHVTVHYVWETSCPLIWLTMLCGKSHLVDMFVHSWHLW